VKRPLKPEELKVWGAVAATVHPLPGRRVAKAAEPDAKSAAQIPEVAARILPPKLSAPKPKLREDVDVIEPRRKHRIAKEREEIGARLATRWRLPEILIDTIRYHHTPDLATVDPVLAGTAHLAETLSWAVGVGAELGDCAFDVSATALAITGLDMNGLRGLDTQLTYELQRAQDFL